MPYIGAKPNIEFTTIPSKDSFTGDGSTTTFDLATAVATSGENALEVFVNNVRQEPGTGKAFTLGPDGSNDTKRITFTAAPANGATIYVINDKTNYTTLINPKDLNGVELILDGDGDTSITADTDDRIDLKIGGVEHISFNNSSGDTIIKPMVDAKDIVFQQYDGNKILEINDGNYVAISGAAAGPGELRFYEDTDNGVLYTGFKAGNVTSSVSYVLPTADGSSGYQLTTDGSGTLSWAASTLALANDGNNRIATGTGSGGLNAEANLTFDGSVLAATGNITATGTMEPAGDTAASDNAAIGYTSAEGLILTGQGSTNDITIKNDADTDVISIPTGTTGVTLAGTLGVGAITGTSTIQGTTITATTAFVPDASDGAALGTAALEFSDLFLADSAVLNFGDDQDTTLTHTDGTGLTLNSTNKLCFYDTALSIHSSTDGQLDLIADTEIQIAATTIDINGAVDISGNTTFGGLVDVNGVADGLVIDADGDTTISSPTDDQIDFEISGADDFQMTANTLTALSGSTIATNTIAETTGASGVTIDGVLIKDTTVDVNGTADAIILDADGDTTISAPTGNQIDFEIAGADDFTMTANTFTILAGSTIVNSGTMSPDISSTGKALVLGF